MGVPICVCQSLSCVQLFVTPWTVAHQAPLPTEFSYMLPLQDTHLQK